MAFTPESIAPEPTEPSQELVASVRATTLQRLIDGPHTYTFPSVTIGRHDVDAFLYDQESGAYYSIALINARRKGIFRRGIIVSEPDDRPVTVNSQLDLLLVTQITPRDGEEGSAGSEELQLSFEDSSDSVRVRTWYRGDRDVTAKELSEMQERIGRAKNIKIRDLPPQVRASLFN